MKKTDKKTILITGGAGFIGSCLADKLAQNEANQVIIVDNLLTGSKSNIPFSIHNNIQFIYCDVNQFEEISAIFYSNKIDYVFHYAALVGVKRTLQQPLEVLDDIAGIKNILSLSKITGVKRVFYSSSSEVYGEPVEFPQNEDTTPLNSRLPYAIVKNVGEAYFRSFNQIYEMDYTIFRFFNTYGPKQSRDFVISKFVNAALHDKDITIYGDGGQTRTFCYIDDNIDACINAMINNHYINETVNIGNNNETRIVDLAHRIIQKLNSNSNIVFLPPLKEGDMSRRLPDIRKMKNLLGRELLSLNEGLEFTINYYLNPGNIATIITETTH
jgi:UDP-glucose 4-epimerase